MRINKEDYKIKKISVVIPAKDEEANLGLVLDELNNTLNKINKDFEIIVVNDKSKDRTGEIAIKKSVKLINSVSGTQGYRTFPLDRR